MRVQFPADTPDRRYAVERFARLVGGIPDGALVYAEHALGLGAIGDVCDVVYIRNEAFDSARTQQIADEIGALNNRMRAEKRSYVLIGPGRWGSSDPWLGIPVKWTAISEAKVIVECGLENFRVEPSQGDPFFPEPHVVRRRLHDH